MMKHKKHERVMKVIKGWGNNFCKVAINGNRQNVTSQRQVLFLDSFGWPPRECFVFC